MKNKNWRVARDFRIIQRIRKPSKNEDILFVNKLCLLLLSLKIQ